MPWPTVHHISALQIYIAIQERPGIRLVDLAQHFGLSPCLMQNKLITLEHSKPRLTVYEDYDQDGKTILFPLEKT